MDKQAATNIAVLCGSLGGRPIFSHSCHGRDYYTFPLVVPRLSGTEDSVNIIAEKTVIESAENTKSEYVRGRRIIRTYIF